MDTKITKIDSVKKPAINRVEVNIEEDGVKLQGFCNFAGDDNKAHVVARALERDMRINNKALFPIPEPEPTEELEEMEPSLTKEVR
jgi:hypothetical protein